MIYSRFDLFGNVLYRKNMYLQIGYSKNMTTKTGILKWLAYFDIFQHPLTNVELAMLCACETTLIDKEVLELEKAQQCFFCDGFVSLNRDISSLINDRRVKELEAQNYFEKLPRYVRLIRRFPFVKGIAISGSLSKNVMYKDGDVDYFIITSENRLWLCRTLLILYKKTVLLNSRKFFCLNYFVDEKNLKIPDENLFTAVEIAYLLPVYNVAIFDQLKAENGWIQKFIPPVNTGISTIQLEKRTNSYLLEKLVQGKLGDTLDTFFMKLTYRRWQRKFPAFPKVKFDQTMRTQRGVSKHHPRDFQAKVLTTYKSKLQTLNIEDEGFIQS